MYRIIGVIVVSIILGCNLYAQGCSDAGVCSINAFYGHETSDNTVNNTMSISQTAELGEQNMLYFHTILGVSYKHGKFKHQLTVPYRTMTHKGSVYSGISDLTLSSSYSLLSKLNFTMGVKLPPNSANREDKDGNALPMALQTSLGTYDVLSSISYMGEKWHASFGWQHAFGANENAFLANEKYPDFKTTVDFERGDDLMFRLDRYFKKDAGLWQLALVSVYRLTEDKTNGVSIDRSSGLSVNVYAARSWQTENGELKLASAVPITVRDIRPDGTTRTFQVSLTWSGSFVKPKE